MSEAAIALVGVAIGGVLSAATALTAPWVTSMLASRRFREELEWRRLDELAALMDDAGLALERFHWSLTSAIDAIEHGGNGGKDLAHRRAAVGEARDHASSLGSRLAIRLGPRTESDLVAVYDDFQTGYRNLAETVLNREKDTLDARSLRQDLDPLANHDRYFRAARTKREELGAQLAPKPAGPAGR